MRSAEPKADVDSNAGLPSQVSKDQSRNRDQPESSKFDDLAQQDRLLRIYRRPLSPGQSVAKSHSWWNILLYYRHVCAGRSGRRHAFNPRYIRRKNHAPGRYYKTIERDCPTTPSISLGVTSHLDRLN